MKRILPLLALGLTAPLAAQSELMTYGDVIGAAASAEMTGLTPSTPVLLIPSFLNNGSSFLVGLTGDPNDQLAVGIDLAANGNVFGGTSDANGDFSFNFVIPNNPGFLDTAIYWQGWTEPGGVGAARYDDFSNLRTMSLNNASRWQSAEDAVPVASANLAYVTWGEGNQNGDAMKVFACGGGPALLVDVSTAYPTIDQCWEFDGVTGLHTLLPGTMSDSRAFHNLVRLQDGRFMAIGGITGPFGSGNNHYTKVLRTCEIYDPVLGTWTNTANMAKYRAGATATVLPDGRVLVAGGTEGNGSHELHDVADLLGTALKSTEIYDPVTDTWSFGSNMTEFKAGAMAITLSDGRWLVSGGVTHTLLFGIPIPDFSNNQQVYDPTTGNWSNVANMKDKRALGGIALMQNGSVYIAGGAGGDIFNIGPIRDTEIYNPTTGNAIAKPNLGQESAFNRCIALGGSRVMIVGGARGDLVDPIPIKNCWIYDNASSTVNTVTFMPEAHAGGVVSLMEDGTIYSGGGESDTGLATTAARSYSQ
ncbi:MAG: Kelch repeat-containing protein [Planctomycetota bacterium]